ncbi:PREDICTED: histone-lysine N-methyltransferase SUV39H2 [Chaetura pelagica]|uniref:histone-lysine N-methyltransferase SUV39H2 n=1 Tax=Chaetura pelagica TaxID=8897 RepID=UPI000523334B|nr:PREDICTED: histone-lysine N-methyltransferase SUV39H2 [Chaetura pelagica]
MGVGNDLKDVLIGPLWFTFSGEEEEEEEGSSRAAAALGLIPPAFPGLWQEPTPLPCRSAECRVPLKPASLSGHPRSFWKSRAGAFPSSPSHRGCIASAPCPLANYRYLAVLLKNGGFLLAVVQLRDALIVGKLLAWYVPCLASIETLQELCRKENLRCKAIGITNKSLKRYEVEYLCDYKVEEGTKYYLVKWKGWPESSNTWEPQKNLNCPLLLQNFLSDRDEYLSRLREGKALKLRNHLKALKPAVTDYIVRKAKQRIALKRWKEELNRKKNHKAMILVENTVDLEGPPIDFYYINEYKPAPGINVLNGIMTGCECADCPAEKCCPKEAGFILAYNKRKKLKIQPGLPIYECNSFCRCGPDCPNRIVQKGTPYSLCIFRTNNGRGWGVKTLQTIKTNSFVMEYVGEVITSEEAERRGQLYDNQGITYLFDLDYDSDEFTVDAARYGNVSHFVNHSCDPNLQVFNVFIDNLDLRLPRIALFSTRTIKAGEELTFDYQMKGSIDLTSDSADGLSPSKKRIRTVCKCGAVCCRGYLN